MNFFGRELPFLLLHRCDLLGQSLAVRLRPSLQYAQDVMPHRGHQVLHTTLLGLMFHTDNPMESDAVLDLRAPCADLNARQFGRAHSSEHTQQVEAGIPNADDLSIPERRTLHLIPLVQQRVCTSQNAPGMAVQALRHFDRYQWRHGHLARVLCTFSCHARHSLRTRIRPGMHLQSPVVLSAK